MTAIVPLAHVVEQARAFQAAARADRTRAEYRKQWAAFTAWCAGRELRPLPADPATLALYLTDRAGAGLKPASLAVAIAAVRAQHQAAGLPSPHNHPQVSEIWQGIRRTLGTAPRRVSPVLVADLQALLGALPRGLLGVRDRALLVVGMAGALRRSELASLEVADLEFAADGLVITIRRSKRDQVAAGARVGLPIGSNSETCPVRTLQAWLDASGITEGPVFRSVDRHGHVGRGKLDAGSIARVVKRAAEAAGLDPAIYSGHSLRAGLATQAAKLGKADRAIMAQGRWSSRSTVDRYVRDARVLDEDNAARGIGL